VTRKRGGWCYETHELLNWALREIGFNSRIVTAAIHREQYGDSEFGNHTAILVDLDQTYLADLGLGDGIRDPIPLREGTYDQGRLRFTLERTTDDYWRFRNHAFAYPTNFDFRDEPLNEAQVDRHAAAFQSGEDPTFIKNLACQIMFPETVTCLSGRVLRFKSPDGTTKKLVEREQFAAVLREIFGIVDAEADSVWPGVEARHQELFGDRPISEVSVSGF
jgi:N-hydroxyarylamine O-acetyltransferase